MLDNQSSTITSFLEAYSKVGESGLILPLAYALGSLMDIGVEYVEVAKVSTEEMVR